MTAPREPQPGGPLETSPRKPLRAQREGRGVRPEDTSRLVFVGGVHRSGTTPLARALESHPDVAGMRGTGAPRDEGQHVQSVYPPADRFGGAGSFALHRRSHMDERSARTGDRDRLLDDWAPYWAADAPLLLEKSPPNIVRMRFLQTLFPGARFIVLVRHPVAVTMNEAVWMRASRRRRLRQSRSRLLRNWLAAHEVLVRDAAHIDQLLVVRYEELTRSPATTLAAIDAWLGLHRRGGATLDLRSSNERYLASWAPPGEHRLAASRRRRLERRFAASLARFGATFEGTGLEREALVSLLPTAEVR